MPFAVTHFISSCIIMRLARLRLDKKMLLGSRELFICLIFGLLPDLDMAFQKLYKIFGVGIYPHRILTHNMIVPLLILLAGLVYFSFSKNKLALKIVLLFFAIWSAHICLDLIFMGPVYLLAPLSMRPFGYDICTSESIVRFFISIDAVLLFVWLGTRYWLSARKK